MLPLHIVVVAHTVLVVVVVADDYCMCDLLEEVLLHFQAATGRKFLQGIPHAQGL